MPFIFQDLERLSRAAERLREDRWKKAYPLSAFTAVEDDGKNGAVPPAALDGNPMKTGDEWSGYDRYIWLSVKTTASKVASEELWGRFDFGITGGGNNSGFESLCFINGEAWQGVDQNHQEIPLRQFSGKEILIQFRLWSGLTGGGRPRPNVHKIKRAELAVLDSGADKLYYCLTNLLEAYRTFPEKSVERERLLNLASKAWSLVDTSLPGSSDFYESAAEAVNFIVSRLGKQNGEFSLSVIGHTHIDTAWLWRLRHTTEKAARSFSTVLRFMEDYPEYIFLHTQAQQYEYIKKYYPAIFENVKKRVAEGRWEPGGAMWVECDCNLPSGESLVRQILYGVRFFEQEFQAESSYLWLPDVFGYSAALPQILKKCGLNTFITTKISWNDQNRMPYDTFEWKGIDGTTILTHFITTPAGKETTMYSYNGMIDAASLRGIWDNYSNKGLNSDLLLCYGYGDGGGGPTRDMLENLRVLSQIPGMPAVKTERVDEYCARLCETVKENSFYAYQPVWEGELYLEFHRGTYTSQAYNKKMNRKMEFLLRNTEFALSCAMLRGEDTSARQGELNEIWKQILCGQFHDIIPGSSIHEVYEDTREMYQKTEAAAKRILQDSLNLQGSPDHYTALNTANWERSSVVEIAGDFTNMYFEAEDAAVCKQVCGPDKAVLLLEKLPPMATKTLRLRQGALKPFKNCAKVFENGLETDLLKLSWDQNGHLTSIYDKTAGREMIPVGSRANVITLSEDRPRDYDAWELEYTYHNKSKEISAPLSIKAIENNPVRAIVEMEYIFGNSRLSQNIVVYSHTPRIDFKTTVEWKERETLMKVSFPTTISSSRARYDIQYGSLERPTTRNTSWEFAKYEVVGHKWADFSESGYGAALMNDCKYGYDIHENTLNLTLLKSSNFPDYAADFGLHEFTYALFPHQGDWYEANVDGESWELNDAPLVFRGKAVGFPAILPANLKGFTIDAVKPAEDGNFLVIRTHEKEGRHASVSLPFHFPFLSWSECDLLERSFGEMQTSSSAFLTFTPYEIKTIKIAVS